MKICMENPQTHCCRFAVVYTYVFLGFLQIYYTHFFFNSYYSFVIYTAFLKVNNIHFRLVCGIISETSDVRILKVITTKNRRLESDCC